ncbi:hypothetical protein DE146DRAFT_615218 [Phaeosphaeria sp. MPI-PUGE-AT-0046c]|nr:hypothetical protein DE146DRAFT_615218 [Phaeosphaeria sp. MPI-PUGE-AT-0046c]
MECRIYPFVQPFGNFDGAFGQSFFSFTPNTPWNISLARLRQEKDILENGLAITATYLHALRTKQVKIDRLLQEPALARPKRKKAQYKQRQLEREIRNRQRDEDAFLSNIQICKANIYVLTGCSYVPTDVSSTVADCTSSTTQYSCPDSASTEISWNGWTEDAVVSPFEQSRSEPFFAEDVAPDEVTELEVESMASRQNPRPLPLLLNLHPLDTLPVPPNTSILQHEHSSLSPEAMVFQPSDIVVEPAGLNIEAKATKLVRSSTEAGIYRPLQHSTIVDHKVFLPNRRYTWCQNTPQRSPQKPTHEQRLRRCRTNSL